MTVTNDVKKITQKCAPKTTTMTPERKAEIDKQIEWWRKITRWRVEGFNIVCNDPLFAPREQKKKD